MPYISIALAGKATFGGYLSIDGGNKITLKHGMLIPISAGTHYVRFHSVAKEDQLKNFALALIDVDTSRDGELTMEFLQNNVLEFTIVSDANRQILSQPDYKMYLLDEEQMLEMHRNYSHQKDEKERQAIIIRNENIKKAKTAFWLCLGLGWAGAHKFYRRKYFMGIVYLFTVGLFGYGWIFDCISLAIDWRNAKIA